MKTEIQKRRSSYERLLYRYFIEYRSLDTDYSKEGEDKILYESNIDEVLPIASISKLMTAVVVAENYSLEEAVRVSEDQVVARTEFRDFRAWEETSIEEMKKQMIIESNNSGAFALALISDRYIKSDKEPVESFIERMNEKAKEIGLNKTSFINPSGLDRQENYNASTVKEIALFAKYIISNHPEIFEISVIPSYSLFSPDKAISYTAINTNTFLHIQENEWQSEIVGGKTGFTRFANGCLLIVLQDPHQKGYIISVVLGAEDRFKEMEKLINYIYFNYQF